MSFNFTSHHITSYHIICNPIIYRDIISYNIALYRIFQHSTSNQILSCHITSYDISYLIYHTDHTISIRKAYHMLFLSHKKYIILIACQTIIGNPFGDIIGKCDNYNLSYFTKVQHKSYLNPKCLILMMRRAKSCRMCHGTVSAELFSIVNIVYSHVLNQCWHITWYEKPWKDMTPAWWGTSVIISQYLDTSMPAVSCFINKSNI